MMMAFMLIGAIVAVCFVLTAVLFCVAGSKCEAAQDEIDFTREEWEHPFHH